MIKKKEPNRPKSIKETLKKVSFTLVAPEAKSVLLSGDFNAWNTCSHPLKKDARGKWEIDITLKPGSYQYRFIVDGSWRNDPKCNNVTPNSFGSKNCVLTLV